MLVVVKGKVEEAHLMEEDLLVEVQLPLERLLLLELGKALRVAEIHVQLQCAMILQRPATVQNLKTPTPQRWRMALGPS